MNNNAPTLRREKKNTPWGIVSTVLVVIAVLVAVVLMGLKLLGFRTFTVISGSMEPKFSVGDLVYVKEVPPEEIKVGDSITFVLNENLAVATHNVIQIDAEKQHFFTQGLANDTPDASPVHFKNLIGRAEFAIPKLGYVSDWIQNPPGLYITIVALAVFVVLMFLPDMFKKKGEQQPSSESSASVNDELEAMRAELAAVRAELNAKKTEDADKAPEKDTEGEE